MERFQQTETWIFDLDNTLYPAECNLFAQIDKRMGAFIADYLNIDPVEARKIQKRYFIEHGTTLNGLMTVHGLKPDIFLDYVHDIDHSPVPHDPDLGTALSELSGRKVIFTNGTRAHAEKVLARLGIDNHFAEIYDIAATGYRPKPYADAYDQMLKAEKLAPEAAAMFEDIPRNLEIPHALGMTTILVRSGGPHPDEEFGLTGTGDEAHVHHITDDLAGFLAKLSSLKD